MSGRGFLRAGVAGALALGVAAACGCSRGGPPVRRTWPAMGTLATVTVAGSESSRLEEAATESRRLMEDGERRLSVYRPDSEISRVNAAAGAAPVEVSAATRDVVRQALAYAEWSGGAFDVTVEPLMRLWGFRGGETPAALPEASRLAAARANVGFRHVVVSDKTMFLDAAGARLDLGGIAKGYAVDVCSDRLRAMGIRNAMVDLGGNLRCHGGPRPGEPWKIGVRHPFEGERLLGVLRLADGWAVATSGNYERFVSIGGKRYAHILDPRTGYPVEGMAAVTVVAPTATDADALSTTLFVLGIENGRRILARKPGCHALCVPDRQPVEIRVTPGFRKFFTPEPAFADHVRDWE